MWLLGGVHWGWHLRCGALPMGEGRKAEDGAWSVLPYELQRL